MNNTLRKTIGTIAAVTTAIILTANTSEARPTVGKTYKSTSYVTYSPIHRGLVKVSKVFRYIDRYGKPVYSHYKTPIKANKKFVKNAKHSSYHSRNFARR